MADGITHGRITISLALLMPPVVMVTTSSPLKAILFGVGCLLGLIVDPDLDVNHITESERRMIKVFGPVAYLWIGLWLPYALLIPHRSPLSHMPIVGTAIRLVYLLSWACVVCNALGMVDWLLLVLQTNLEALTWLVLGLVIADTGHWLADLRMFSQVWRK